MRRLNGRGIALLSFAAMTFGVAGCRFVLGLTERTEGTEPDSGGLDAGIDSTVAEAGIDSSVPQCFGPQCVPRSCAAVDGGAGGDGSAGAHPLGTGAQCGPAANEDCCAVTEIMDGGTFLPNNCSGAGACDGGGGPTTLSAFRLDTFEITVGRFKRFVNDGFGVAPGNPPPSGSGRHPKLEFSDWKKEWNVNLQPNTATFVSSLSGCAQTFGTWTTGDNVPITCVTWYEAFAFCIYDGGRLPTEAEWSFAATGGDEQRTYPWGSTDPDLDGGMSSFATYCPNGNFGAGPTSGVDGFNCTASPSVGVAGSLPMGRGRFGNADLGGNAWEWVFDWWSDKTLFPCTDCAVVSQPPNSQERVIRGGSWVASKGAMLNSSRYKFQPSGRDTKKGPTVGFRCARDYGP